MFLFFFIFFSTRDLQAPSADRCETLPHDRKLVAFYNPIPKFGGPSPGLKTCRIRGNFGQLRTLIANISGMDQDIKNWKDVIDCYFSRVRGKTSSELWSIANKVGDVDSNVPISSFLEDHILASSGCCPLLFVHVLENGLASLACYPTPHWIGGPQQFSTMNIQTLA